jgi:hypothetical protein
MRGNINFSDTRTTGTALPPGQPNGEVDLTTSADDDALYELLCLQPPSAASATNVAVGYCPIWPSTYNPVTHAPGAKQPGLLASVSSGVVTVNPVRLIRSSINSSTPRALLSATIDAATTIAVPTAPSSEWGVELLCGLIQYVNPSIPAQGTVASLFWATSPTYVSTGTAVPNIASIPASSSGTWVVPLIYVVNVSTASLSNHRLISGPVGFYNLGGGNQVFSMGHLVPSSQKSLAQSTRAYSAAANSIAAMVSGGGPFSNASGLEFISPTSGTPMAVGRSDQEYVVKSIKIPADTAHSSGDFDVDDTRDWRNGDFFVRFIVGAYPAADNFAEEDPANTAYTRQLMPYTAHDTGSGSLSTTVYLTTGNSFVATTPNASTGPTTSQFWAGVVSPDIAQNPANLTTPTIAPTTGHYFGLYVSATTGALRFTRSATGGVISSYWIIVEAFFPNRPR